MNLHSSALGPRPPLTFAWQAPLSLACAAPEVNALYGIAQDGTVAAIDPTTGAARWQTTNQYLTKRLTTAGSKIYAYRRGVGLATITDNGNSFDERILVSVNPLTENSSVSQIAVDAANNVLYFSAQQALLAITRDGVLAGGTDAGPETPHALFPAGAGQVLEVDGYGFPSLWVYNNKTFIRRWQNILPGLGAARAERTALVNGNVVYCTQEVGVTCVRLDTGDTVWRNRSITARALALDGDTLFVAGPSAQVWALDAGTGNVLWDRMYIYGTTATTELSLSVVDGSLYVGALVDGGGPVLFAVNTADGSYQWQANSAKLPFGTGLICALPDKLVMYGSDTPAAAMSALAGRPSVGQQDIAWSPNPLRGPASGFSGQLQVRLSQSAQVSAAAWRENGVRGGMFVNQQSWGSGTHSVDWNAGSADGFTSDNQFGKIAVDVTESSGLAYTVVQLVPVNTLPDLQHHWSKPYVEAMLYNQFISGYPDLTFKPDNLVNRAESSTIIAKTLGLSGPSAGFQTKFTDIATHWARSFIMALEERGIVGGFQEPDGSFTFRPEVNMTRGQEARILVRAYSIPAAPSGFSSKFTDIAGHWAESDIRALEAGGFVNGFQESDGTFTYRPEQNLTRAELCTVVVRIRHLSRP